MATRRKRRASGVVALVSLSPPPRRSRSGWRWSRARQSAFALPRAQTFYMSGNQWSPYNDVNPAKTWDYIDGHRRVRVRDRVPVQPADGQLHPVARDERNVDVEHDVRHDDPQGGQVD